MSTAELVIGEVSPATGSPIGPFNSILPGIENGFQSAASVKRPYCDGRAIAIAELIDLYKREFGTGWEHAFNSTVRIEVR